MKTFNNILAIETSGPICSIALRSEKRIESACSENENEHGLVILNFIEKLLKKSGLKKNDLDLIAISNGPGSFTGLRVANSVAQALAFANDIPLLPISSLAVLANQASIKLKKNRISVIVNAHMKELYVADYFCKKDAIDVLKKEGYIIDYQVTEAKNKIKIINVKLKYYDGQPVIKEIKRISKPGRRVYSRATSIPKVLNGLGLAILSTSKGVMSDAEATKNNLGGEIICRIF